MKGIFLKRHEYAIIETGENVIENNHYQYRIYLHVENKHSLFFASPPSEMILISKSPQNLNWESYIVSDNMEVWGWVSVFAFTLSQGAALILEVFTFFSVMELKFCFSSYYSLL